MNRIIVVTGGAAGIGRCTVEYFASKGDRIYFIDNNQEATLALTERMHQKGLNVTGYTGDIAEKQVLEDFARRVLDEQPQGIHCLINNACLMHGGILEGCDYEDFLCDERNTFINGENITVDGGMSKLMVYHNDCGWTYRP